MQQRTTHQYRVLLALLCGVLVLHAVHLACIVEDAFISFRFARNFAAGHGFVWNVGEPPIEGFTTFLWVLLSGLGIRAGLDVLFASQVLGTLSALGTLVLTFVFARRQLGASNGIALVPCVFLAFSGPLAAWASSGMEITTFGFCILLGVFGYLEFLKHRSVGWLVCSGLVLCTATLVRPEGGLVVVVLGSLAVTVFLRRTLATFGHHVVWGLTYTLPLALFLWWRWNEFGDLVPNTFHQKTGGGIWQYYRGLGYLINFAFFYLLPLLPLALLLGWERGLPGVRQLGRVGDWLRSANAHEAITTSVALIFVYSVYLMYVGGDYMALYRFMVPLLPFIYLMLVPVLEAILESAGAMPHKARLTALTVAAAVAATFVHSTPLESSFFRIATWQHGNYRGVLAERRYVKRFAFIGNFFADYAKSPTDSLATRSIGVIGYLANDLTIHDLTGLTDRHIASQPGRATNQTWAGHEKWDLDYSFGRLPTYFMFDENLVAEDVPASAHPSAFAMADAVEQRYPVAKKYADWMRANPQFIEENYQLTSIWLDDEAEDEHGYFMFLERKPAEPL